MGKTTRRVLSLILLAGQHSLAGPFTASMAMSGTTITVQLSLS